MKILKKFGILFVVLFFVVVIAILSLLGIQTIDKYKAQIAKRDDQISTLEAALTDIGELQPAFVVTANVRAGDMVTEDNVQEVDVPVKIGGNIVNNKELLDNKYFKISLDEGTLITNEDIVERKITSSLRYYDIVLDELPLDIKDPKTQYADGNNGPSEYIDIRISFPFGEDFIAIAHKKTEAIYHNSNVITLILSEEEISTYNSMLVDKVLYPGATIYAVKYIEGGVQAPAEVFYPVMKNISEITAIDPNILEAVKQEMVIKRAQIDNAMGGSVDEKSDTELEKINSQIEKARNTLRKSIATSQKELVKRWEAEKKAAEKAAKSNK